ncbi:unnamed protein product [Orchesella dallaii]|uniref:Uncharacterized protein n=1 Tax=Orchesella dallaii TaxID=48710 RepID=A0ABP1QAT0_9HEXA
METRAFEDDSPSKVSLGSSEASPSRISSQSRNSSRSPLSLDTVSSGDLEFGDDDDFVPFGTELKGAILGPIGPPKSCLTQGEVMQYSPKKDKHEYMFDDNLAEMKTSEYNDLQRYTEISGPRFDWRFAYFNAYPFPESVDFGEAELMMKVEHFVDNLLEPEKDDNYCRRPCNTMKAFKYHPDVELSLVGKITIPPPESPRTSRQLFTNDRTYGAFRYELAFKDNCESEHRIKFCMQDRIGCFTLLEGDGIQFQLARVMSSKHQRGRNRNKFILRAKNITLMDEYILASGEDRMNGVIYHVVPPKRYGFLLCAGRKLGLPSKIFFRVDEFLDPDVFPYVGQNVEFTIMNDTYDRSFRVAARRIKPLPFGCAKFGYEIAESTGVVVSLPFGPPLSSAAYVNYLRNVAQNFVKNGSSVNNGGSHLHQLEEMKINSLMVRSYYDFIGKPGYILHGPNWRRDKVKFYWNTCVQTEGISVGCPVRMTICYWNPHNSLVAFRVEQVYPNSNYDGFSNYDNVSSYYHTN